MKVAVKAKDEIMKNMNLIAIILAVGSTSFAGGLFSNIQPLQFTLSAPFEQLFSVRESPMHPQPPNFVPTTVQGQLTYNDDSGRLIVLHPKLKMRGNSSQDITECVFPKIKMEFAANEIRGTIFENHTTVGIGSHCSSQGGFSHIGRNWDGKTPHREVLAYEILKLVGVPTYQARAAWFNYIEQSTGQAIGGTHEALLLEDMDSMLQRYGASKVSAPYESLAHSPGVTVEDVARIYFAETIVGNWDWYLKMQFTNESISKRFWNMKEIQRSNGNHLIFPYDFDLADLVVLRMHTTAKTSEMTTLFPQALRARIAADLRAKEKELRSLGQRLTSDSAGQAFYKKQMDRFFAKLPELTK